MSRGAVVVIACRQDKSARAGLTHLVKTEVADDAETATWDQIQAIYRCWLYEEGQEVRDDEG